jgi:hypothetical protein
MRVDYRMFRGTFKSWNTLFQEAAAFASSVGENLISISHSADETQGVVTVWFWVPQ